LLLVLESETAGARENERTHPVWVEVAERVRQMATVSVHRYDAWSVDADDIVQDVMLRLQSPGAIRRVRLAGSPQGYMAVIVRNRVLDELRRNRLRWRGDSATQTWEDAQTGIVPTAEAGLDLQRVLATLSDDERELIRLRFWEGYSIQDLAERLQVPYSTASVRLFRLLRKLRDQFGDEQGV
jgi:RNA polymerase sigma-70 factor (ECF subfamily)